MFGSTSLTAAMPAFKSVARLAQLEMLPLIGFVDVGVPVASQMLISMPLEVAHFEVHDYLIPDIQDQQLDSISADVLQALPRDKGMLFFALPAKVTELEEVAEYFPDGKWREVKALPIPGQPPTMLYYSYQVPPGSTPGH